MKSLRLLSVAALLATGVVVTTGAVAASASAASAPSCIGAHLKVSVGTSQGAAGTIWYPIVFTNTGASACSIWGVPAIQPVVGGSAHSTTHVGPPAHNNSMGAMPVRHEIAPGKSVSAGFGVTESGNYTASTCVAKNAGAVVVTLGGFVANRYLTLHISVCTKIASTHTQLLVAGVTGA